MPPDGELRLQEWGGEAPEKAQVGSLLVSLECDELTGLGRQRM